MDYEVIMAFTDLQDKNYVYNAGDKFPRIGAKISDARVNELLGDRNKRGVPLIKKVGGQATFLDEPEQPKKTGHTKSEIYRMSKADLLFLAGSLGIQSVDDMNGKQLKDAIARHFNLI